MSLLLLNEDELRQTITITEAIEVIEKAIVASAQGRMHIPGSFLLNLPDVSGKVGVEGIYLQDTPYYVVKIGSQFQNNLAIHLPTKSGLLAVFDAATGFPAAIMLDNGYLANIRAGAVGALAAKYLANEAINQVAVIGSGPEAYIQLKALMVVRPVGSVMIWDHSPLNADNYMRDMIEDHDLNIQIAGSVEAAVRQADIIIISISAVQQPLIMADWLKSGVHITAVGEPAMQEFQADLVRYADVVIVDSLEQGAKQADVSTAPGRDSIKLGKVQGELGSLILGKIPGRTRAEQLTVADLSGSDSQDTALATLALEKALFFGLGQRVELGLRQKGSNSKEESSA